MRSNTLYVVECGNVSRLFKTLQKAEDFRKKIAESECSQVFIIKYQQSNMNIGEAEDVD